MNAEVRKTRNEAGLQVGGISIMMIIVKFSEMTGAVVVGGKLQGAFFRWSGRVIP